MGDTCFCFRMNRASDTSPRPGFPLGASSEEEDERILRRLGEAVLEVWNDLPRDIQRQLFEHAVSGSAHRPPGEIRQRIAQFLHDHKDDGF